MNLKTAVEHVIDRMMIRKKAGDKCISIEAVMVWRRFLEESLAEAKTVPECAECFETAGSRACLGH